jgi:hypothetical protein
MTVPKNTRKAKQAIASARNITCYSLANCFRGEPLTDSPVVWGGPIVNNQYRELLHVSQAEFLARELSGHGKLTESNGHFTLHVHDNLWYEFDATIELPTLRFHGAAGCYCASLPAPSACDFCSGTRKWSLTA